MKNPSVAFCFLMGALLFTSNLSGQSISVDSLLSKARSFNNISVDSSMLYVKQAEELALQNGDDLQRAAVNNVYSYVLILNGQHDRAIEVLAFNLENLSLSNHGLLGETYYNLASAYYLKEEYDQSVPNYLLSIEHFEAAPDKKGLAKANLQVGVIYEKLEKTELANYFFDRSIAGSQSGLDAHPTPGNSEASSPSQKAVMSQKMLDELGDASTITKSFVHYNLGVHEKNSGNCSSAIGQFRASLKIKAQLGYKSNIGKSHLLMAECMIALGRESEALQELTLARANIEERQQVQQIELLTANAYSGLGNTQNALDAYKRYTRVKDSIASLAENERIATITAQFETEKQAKEIDLLTADNQLFEARLSQQRIMIFGIVLVVLLLGLILYLFYQRTRTKRQLEFSEVNRQLLQTQLNPHFLFNALGGIKHLISASDRKRSSDYIQNFSGLMRNILENTTEKFIPVTEDIETIEDYLALQQLVHNHGFDYELTVDPDLETDLLVLPPMFTQPFVENAVVHGMNGTENGLIKMTYQKTDGKLLIRILDNGPGVEKTRANANAMHKSMATSIIEKRKEYLAKTQKYQIEIQSNSSERGVEVLMSFPIKTAEF